MSILNYIAEKRIQEAISNGEFDQLEGFGKPVDMDAYFSVPAEDRIAFHILKNAGVVPEEIEIRKSIYQLTLEIKNTIDPDEISALEQKRLSLQDKLFVLSDVRKARM
jgi:Domain of unknown function (DUF1992).